MTFAVAATVFVLTTLSFAFYAGAISALHEYPKDMVTVKLCLILSGLMIGATFLLIQTSC